MCLETCTGWAQYAACILPCNSSTVQPVCTASQRATGSHPAPRPSHMLHTRTRSASSFVPPSSGRSKLCCSSAPLPPPAAPSASAVTARRQLVVRSSAASTALAALLAAACSAALIEPLLPAAPVSLAPADAASSQLLPREQSRRKEAWLPQRSMSPLAAAMLQAAAVPGGPALAQGAAPSRAAL